MTDKKTTGRLAGRPADTYLLQMQEQPCLNYTTTPAAKQHNNAPATPRQLAYIAKKSGKLGDSVLRRAWRAAGLPADLPVEALDFYQAGRPDSANGAIKQQERATMNRFIIANRNRGTLTKAQERALVNLAGHLKAAREALDIHTPIPRLSKQQAWRLINWISTNLQRSNQ